MRIWMILVPLALLAALVALHLVFKQRRGRWVVSGVALVLGITGYAGWLLDDRSSDELEGAVVVAQTPPLVPGDEFASSHACQECHPQQHHSWHDSFHRSMTQVVTADSVLAPLDDVTLTSRGRSFRLWRDGDEFWADMVDPDWDAMMREQGMPTDDPNAPRVQRKMVMSTGSHHYQTYWINGFFGNELWQVPWVYHIDEQRWMPAEDAFVTPPETPHRLTRWNTSCIQCHVMQGRPGQDPETARFVSSVVDYGIACESCHGPGRRHVEHHQGQSTGQPAELSGEPDPTIVNPARLSHRAASQVCGQCHSYFSFSDPEFWQTGFKYRAGDDLHATRFVHDYEDEYVQSRPDLQTGYWNDGTMRIAGREFSAMDDSACYQLGQMSCLSCHAMHEYEQTDDQLMTGMRGNDACLQCHETYRDQIQQHTHHAPTSAGSLCYNCHMPHTSYGLLKAIRSHRVDSPTAEMTTDQRRPNACNLCHLDKPVQWTAEHLTKWYGQKESKEIGRVAQETSASLLFALTGDAVQRAVTAWSFGWPAAHEASGRHWQVPFLARLLEDPYAAVRFTAYRSLKSYPGFEQFDYDFLGSNADQAAARDLAVELWKQQTEGQDWAGNTVLIGEDGEPLNSRIDELLQFRDDRPILLPE